MQYFLLLTFALLGFSQLALSQAHASSDAAVVANASLSIPPCFVSCGAQVATVVHCKDISDLQCYCKKQEFMVESAKCTLQNCPTEAANSTLTAANFKQLESTCKAVTGSFNLTVPTANDLGMAASANASAGAHGGASSSPHKESSSAMSSTPLLATLVPTTLGMAAIAVGSLCLL